MKTYGFQTLLARVIQMELFTVLNVQAGHVFKPLLRMGVDVCRRFGDQWRRWYSELVASTFHRGGGY